MLLVRVPEHARAFVETAVRRRAPAARGFF